MAIRLPIAFSLAVLFLVGVLVPVPSLSQAPPDSTLRSGLAGTTATMLRGGEMGELLSVYVPRGEAEVQRQLDDSRAVERSAMEEIEGTRRLATDADGRARIMREELQTTRVRADVARQTRDLTATSKLDGTYRRQTHELDYFQQLHDALRADADRLEAERSAASARTRALEYELVVARKNAELLVTQLPNAVTQYRALLHDMLTAQKAAAERSRDAAELRRLVADRRLRQLESLTRLTAARR